MTAFLARCRAAFEDTRSGGEPLPARRLRQARTVLLVTAVVAAVALSWSLNMVPGRALFYPATLLVAVLYVAGTVVSSRLTDTRLPWRIGRREAVEAILTGLALAVVFCVGGVLVRYLPFLQHPVARLLDHERVGYLPLVALTTVVNGVAEEVFYRGALWRLVAPRHRLVATVGAYTVVTACAGIPLLALAAAVLGVVTGVLRHRDRSLVGAVIVHLTWSGVMLLVLPHIVG